MEKCKILIVIAMREISKIALFNRKATRAVIKREKKKKRVNQKEKDARIGKKIRFKDRKSVRKKTRERNWKARKREEIFPFLITFHK